MTFIALRCRWRRSLCQNGKDWKKESGSVHVKKLLEDEKLWRMATVDKG
jgi:hypothetical protein